MSETHAQTPTSRLLVKNLPAHLTERRLREHFAAHGGAVTDAKIMFRGVKHRHFGFIGFASEAQASEARRYFDGTFIDTSKIAV